MVVILILGILSVVAIGNFFSMRERAKYSSCISNQYHVHRAGVVYAADNIPGTVIINVAVLTAANLLMQDVGECPSSGNADFDDYAVQYVNNRLTEVTCSIKGIEHEYTPR